MNVMILHADIRYSGIFAIFMLGCRLENAGQPQYPQYDRPGFRSEWRTNIPPITYDKEVSFFQQ